MSNLQPQELKKKVLRLKELLDQLRREVRRQMPSASVDDIAKAFGLGWSAARRFWSENGSGGPAVIRGIQSRSSHRGLCSEILILLDELPDPYKSLARYRVPMIELSFDVVAAYHVASRQPNVKERDQMNAVRFAAFFGAHSRLVETIIIRKWTELDRVYTPASDYNIRQVLDKTDWRTVRPAPPPVPSTPTPNKSAQLRALIDQILPHFPSRWAMLQQMGIHGESLSNAYAGKARPRVLDRMLAKAQATARALGASSSAVTAPIPGDRNEPGPQIEVPDAFSFTGSYVSQLNSSVRMLEAANIRPEMFTDGNRANLLRIITKLVELAGIDDEAIRRINSVEGMSVGDPRLATVLSALRGAKTR